MLPVFDEVLETLSDGKFHKIEDITFGCRHLNNTQLEAVLLFLENYGFIKRFRKRWSTLTRGAILTPEMFNFLKRVKELEVAK